jgi:RimJ/RimL family protein N-acetyltransferase
MTISLTKASVEEIVILHDSYFQSAEPDGPKSAFAALSALEQKEVFKEFEPDFYFTAREGDKIIGFVGIYPDEECIHIGIFYVVAVPFRGRGYLAPLLVALVQRCRQQFPKHQFIRALSRKENLASIKGLQKQNFVRNGHCVQDVGEKVSYEEYLLRV